MINPPAMPVQPPAPARRRRLAETFRAVVVEDLRSGALNLRPLSPAVRWLGRAGMALLAALVVLTLVYYYQRGTLTRNWDEAAIRTTQVQGSAEATRSSVANLALSFAGPIGLPVAALFFCLAAVSLGWGLALAGARRCAPLVYYLLLLPYGAMLAMVAGPAGSTAAWAEVGAMLVVAAGLYWPLRKAAPAWLWAEILLYAALTGQFFLVMAWLTGGTIPTAPLAAGQVVTLLILTGYWLLLGLDAVDASFRVGHWLAALIARGFSMQSTRWLISLVLVLKIVLILLFVPALRPDAVVTALLLVEFLVLITKQRYDERTALLIMATTVVSTVLAYCVSVALADRGGNVLLLAIPPVIAFICFTVWSLVGKGASFANKDTALLSRPGRLLLLLGCVTLAAATMLFFFAARDDAFEVLVNRVSIQAVLVSGLPFALYLLVNRAPALVQLEPDEEESPKDRVPGWSFVLLALAIAAGFALTSGPSTARLAQAAVLANRADALARSRPEEAERLYRSALAAYPAYYKGHFNLGTLLYGAGRVEEAVPEFQAAIDANPDSIPAYANLGVALTLAGHTAEAEAVYKRALELDAGPAYVYNGLGVISLIHGEWAQAEGYLNQAIAVAAQDRAEYYENIGQAELETGRWEEAIAHLQQAVELAPASPDAYIGLGLLYNKWGILALRDGQAGLSQERYRLSEQAYEAALARGADPYIVGTDLAQLYLDMGELDRAEELARRALGDYPGDANLHNILGIILCQKGDSAGACTEFQAAKQFEPAYPYAWAGEALLDLQHKKYAQSAAGYEEALHLGLDRDYVHYNLGLSYAGLGRHADAVAQFDAVIALNASYTDFARRHKAVSLAALGQDEAAIALWKEVEGGATAADYAGMGQTYYVRGDLQTAEHYYRLAISAYPDEALAYTELGLLLQEQDKVQEAITCYRKAVELAPTAEAYAQLGSALLRAGDIDGAEQAYRQAIAIDPASSDGHAGLGDVLIYNDDTAGARLEYEQALALNPDHPLANFRLGQLYYEDGRYREAIPFLERSAAADPTSPDAYTYLGLTYSALGKEEEAIAAIESALAVCGDAGTCALLQQMIDSLR